MSGRTFFALAAILIFGTSLAWCQKVAREACPSDKRCLEEGNGQEPNSLNPQIATTVAEAAILREVFEGVYTDAADGSPMLGVADQAQTSPDGLTWTFHLRPETWSDGQPVTARDFVYAYQRMLDPKTGSSYAYLLYILKNAQGINSGTPTGPLGAVALDDHTLQLTLEHPASYLPELLKHQAFFPIPAHSVEVLHDHWADPGKIVSNGAYTLSEWKLGDYVRLEKNPRYRDADKLCFDRVDFAPTNDPIAAERRVLRGELDLSNSIQSNRVPRLRGDPKSAPFVHTYPYLNSGYLIFNIKDVAPLKDVRVRQAISMAIDRQFITDKLLRAGQIPTTSYVPHGIAGYLPKDAPHPAPYWDAWPLERRQAEARRLLAQAGYSTAHPLKLELKTINGGGTLVTAQSYQADLRSVGVNIDFRQEDGAVVFESFNLRDFQLGATGWVADYNDPMTFLNLMKSDTGQQNYGDYNNPAYDALLKAADNEPDATKRAGDMARAEQMILNDAVIAPILTGVSLNLVNPGVKGWVDNDADIHPVRYLCRNDAPRPVSQPAR